MLKFLCKIFEHRAHHRTATQQNPPRSYREIGDRFRCTSLLYFVLHSEYPIRCCMLYVVVTSTSSCHICHRWYQWEHLYICIRIVAVLGIFVVSYQLIHRLLLTLRVTVAVVIKVVIGVTNNLFSLHVYMLHSRLRVCYILACLCLLDLFCWIFSHFHWIFQLRWWEVYDFLHYFEFCLSDEWSTKHQMNHHVDYRWA